MLALNVEFAFPEREINTINESVQSIVAILPDPKHCGRDEVGIPDFFGTANGQVLKSCVASTVIVRVLYPGPLLSAAILFNDFATFSETGAAQVTGNIEHKGAPVEPDAQLSLQLAGRLNRKIGIGAFDIDIDNRRRV